MTKTTEARRLNLACRRARARYESERTEATRIVWQNLRLAAIAACRICAACFAD